MQKTFYFLSIISILLTIIISLIIIPHIVNSLIDSGFYVKLVASNYNSSSELIDFNNLSNNSTSSLGYFIWPTPGYKTITSGFGYRKAPTRWSWNLSWWNRYWCSARHKDSCNRKRYCNSCFMVWS